MDIRVAMDTREIGGSFRVSALEEFHQSSGVRLLVALWKAIAIVGVLAVCHFSLL